MIDQPLGASLDRDLTTAPGRRADKEIDNFISRRDQQRRKEEGERQEEAWKESVRRYEAARDAHLRQECAGPHSPGPPSQGHSRSSRGTSRGSGREVFTEVSIPGYQSRCPQQRKYTERGIR